MKNLSFGKLMAIFGGFLVVVMVGTVVAMKTLAKRGGQNVVVTKKYAPQQQADATPTTATPVSQGASVQQFAFVPQPGNAASASAPVGMATAQPAGMSASTMASSVPIAMPAGAQATAAEVVQRLSGIDSKLSDLTARVAALEAGKPRPASASASAQAGAKKKKKAVRRAARTPRKLAPTSAQMIAEPKPDDIAHQHPAAATRHKVMGIVGNRVWVRTSDGVEDSITMGEPLPRARVRSIDRDTGSIIMSNGDRIEAR